MRILFVDDDKKWVDLLTDAVTDWNRANPERTFDLTVIGNAEDAAAALTPARFDCALMDLKLPRGSNPGDAANGSELALTALREIGIPVGILSGNPDDRHPELIAEPLARAFTKKPNVCDEVIAWFGDQWEMMAALTCTRTAIDRSGAQIFVRRIWPRWQRYKGLSLMGAPLDRIVTRQYAAHIAELMGVDGGDNPDWHPLENYIHPALLDHRAHTGDLFQLDNEIWVVLTPQCDMANGNVENVLLAHCDPALLPEWDEKLARLGEAQPAPDKVLRYFRDLVNQKVDPSRHFLAPLEDRPLMVNFKKLRLEPIATLNASLANRQASIAPPFLANLTQRFAAYIARPGQPNIGVEHFATPAT